MNHFSSFNNEVHLLNKLKVDNILPEFEEVLRESYELFKDNTMFHIQKKKEKKVKEKRGAKKKLNNNHL